MTARKKPYKSTVDSDNRTYISLKKTHEHETLYEDDLNHIASLVKTQTDFYKRVLSNFEDQIKDDHDIEDWWDFDTKAFKEACISFWKHYKETHKKTKVTKVGLLQEAFIFANNAINASNRIISNGWSNEDCEIARELRSSAIELRDRIKAHETKKS